MDREDRLRQMLHDLRVEMQDRAQPIIDELVKIESMKPPRPMTVPIDPATSRLMLNLEHLKARNQEEFDAIGRDLSAPYATYVEICRANGRPERVPPSEFYASDE